MDTRPDEPDPARAAHQVLRQALRAAKGATRAAGYGRTDWPELQRPDAPPSTEPPRRRRRGYTGAGPDPRDPQPLGREVRRLIENRGWKAQASAASVVGRWDYLVGPQIAARCHPETLRDGELTLVAESTAWATQLRLMVPKILARLADELGADVVTQIRVHGPAAPTWRSGRRTVRGRGPRDTYG